MNKTITRNRKPLNGFSRLAGALLTTMLVGMALLAPSICRASGQAFLKVNQYYFLYTSPVVPYIDRSGTLMVGLNGVARGLTYRDSAPDAKYPHWNGAQIKASSAKRTASLAFAGHMLVFHAGSLEATADGRRLALPSAPIWDAPKKQMIVPMRALLQGLDISSRWDGHRRLLSVTGPDLTYLIDHSDFARGIDKVGDPSLDTGLLVPVASVVHPAPSPPHAYDAAGVFVRKYDNPYAYDAEGVVIREAVIREADNPWLKVTVQNASAQRMKHNHVNALVLYEVGETSKPIDWLSPNPLVNNTSAHVLSAQCTCGVAISLGPDITNFRPGITHVEIKLPPLCVVCWPIGF